jgi:anti-anti-sigma factor
MADSSFEVTVRVCDGRTSLAVRGDVDAYTGPTLADYLDAAVSETTGDLTVDLSAVHFVDSSGIAVLVAAAKKLRDRASELVVQSPPPIVRKVLEMTGVNKLLTVERG